MTLARRSIRSPLAFALACAVFVPAAWAAAPAPEPIDPCTLLTAEEVSAAMGQQVEAARLSDNGVTKDGARSTTCLWQVALPQGVAPDPARSLGGRSFTILNVINWPGGPDDSRKFLDSFRSAFAQDVISFPPVMLEIGADEALWWGDGVAARREGISFGLSVASSGDRALRRPKAESLAKIVVQRLAQRPG